MNYDYWLLILMKKGKIIIFPYRSCVFRTYDIWTSNNSENSKSVLYGVDKLVLLEFYMFSTVLAWSCVHQLSGANWSYLWYLICFLVLVFFLYIFWANRNTSPHSFRIQRKLEPQFKNENALKSLCTPKSQQAGICILVKQQF